MNPNDPRVKLTGEETLEIKGKKLNCQVYQLEDLNGNILRNWYSDGAPFGGLVKIRYRNADTFKLVSYGDKGEKMPGGKTDYSNNIYSPDANAVELTFAEEKTLSETKKMLMEAKPKSLKFKVVDSKTKKMFEFDQMINSFDKPYIKPVLHGSYYSTAYLINISQYVLQVALK